MTTDTQRAAFEAWARADKYDWDLTRCGWSYKEDSTHYAFRGWEARQAATDAARGTAEQVRRDALEEAARECDCEEREWLEIGMDDNGARERVAEVCAKRIRALATSPAPETPRTTDEAVAPRDEHLEEFLREIAACGIAWKRLPAVERALNTYLLARAAPQPIVSEETCDSCGHAMGSHFGEYGCSENCPCEGPPIVAPRTMAATDEAVARFRIDEDGEPTLIGAMHEKFGDLPRGSYSVFADDALPDRTPDARSTSDAAVVLPRLPLLEARDDVAYDVPSWCAESVREYAIDAVLQDRATRSTDSSAEAAVDGNALRDEFEQWYVENAFDFERSLCGQQWFAYAGAHGLSRMEANSILLLRYCLNAEANEAAKLTTAPHTADETRDAVHGADDAADFKRRLDRDDAGIGGA